MTLYSYVVARDFGFAPNPFYGTCTLATCKPNIRAHAQSGDWVVGTGSAVNGRRGRLVYAMKVGETATFTEYWNDPRFQMKRPNFFGSKKQAYGDNIYHRVGATWAQADSHHSLPDGTLNYRNLKTDTKADRVLISTEFVYFGGQGPAIPSKFRKNPDVCAGRGHRSKFPAGFPEAFVDWIKSLDVTGCPGRPLDWNS